MKVNRYATRREILDDVNQELERAAKLHQPVFSSAMEAWGALREEYLEVEEEFRKSSKDPARNSELHKELIQLAAMCVKSVEGCCIIKDPGAGILLKS